MLVGLAPLAQLRRVVKRKSAGDISVTWLALYGGGCLVWLLYGASAGSLPLIVSQAASLASVSATLVVVRRFRAGPAAKDGHIQKDRRVTYF